MRYVEADCAIIYRTRELFGALSNMKSHMPIQYGDRFFYSSEALYQCCRYPGRPDLQKEINVPNAMVAKMKSKPPRSHTRPDWMTKRVPIMEAVVRLKTDQHMNVIIPLLSETRDLDIVEKSLRDAFWGAIPDQNGNLEGQNVLGMIWMLIREEIRLGTFHCDVELEL